jgi:hypothetical protein
MAALLVVAIVRAMSPPRALPCEKIYPFYLELYTITHLGSPDKHRNSLLLYQ